MTADINELRRRMDGALKALHHEFGSLRTGRANAAMLDSIVVDAYGAMMPLNQVSTVSVPEPRMLSVQVWDKGVVKSVEKAINAAGLGVNAIADGQLVRVPIPDLSQERRTELTKVAGKYAEGGKVAIRNVRRDGMDALKKMQKDGEISEDEQKKREGDIQKITDEFIKKIDEALVTKEKEIMGN
ncbi:MAG: ribosome recycling factor [Alphaproteobacteria bacterium]